MKDTIVFIPSWYFTKKKKINGIFFKEQAKAIKDSGKKIIVMYVHIMSLREIFSNSEKLGFSKGYEEGILTYRYNTFNIFPRMYSLYVKYYVHCFNKLIKKIEKDNIEIELLHAQSALLAGEGARINKIKKGIPYIVTEHSSKISLNKLYKEDYSLLKKIYNEADTVIAVSNKLKKDMGKFTDREDIKVIPNFTDIETYHDITEKKAETKEKEFTFFTLAFLTKNKGMDILIEAFSKLKNTNNRLLIGGDGQEKDNLMKLANEKGLSNRITFLGGLNREEALKTMKEADCFVLASRSETFGVVCIEALSQGMPVIVTKCGGPEDIINVNNGILVEVDDVQGLTMAMEHIQNNINLYDSDKIIDDYKCRFSKKVVVEKILETYSECINRGKYHG